MNKIIIGLLLVVLAGMGYLYYDGQQQLQENRQQNATLTLQVDNLRQQVTALEGELKALDEASMRGMVREANSTILDGWQALISTVEGELRKAREAFKDSADNTSTGSPTEGADAGESPASEGG